MTKQELARKIAGKMFNNMSASEVVTVLELAMDTIKETVASGNGVYLRGFGSFITKHRAEKKARNISRNTLVIVPAHNIPYFKPSKAFKVR